MRLNEFDKNNIQNLSTDELLLLAEQQLTEMIDLNDTFVEINNAKSRKIDKHVIS